MPALPPELPGCCKAPGERRPLPDPAAIRLCLVPDSAPPYDREVPPGEPETRWLAAGTAPGAGAGGPREMEHATGDRDRPGRDEDSRWNGPAQWDGPARDGQRGIPGRQGADLDVPPGWPDRFAQVLAETLAGSRPPRQLVPWTTQQALDRIQRLGPRLASAQRPRVRRVVTSLPAPDVIEMSVVVGFGERVKALAVRLERPGTPARGERRAARWVCTAVEAA